MTRRSYISALLVCSFFAVLTATAQDCPQVKIVPERLPNLNIPRFGHTVLNLNGQVTVFGGHADGFIPTPTAEYYHDGKWHLLNTVYSHDTGIALPLTSGKVLLAGGFERNLGIGQTYEAEMYDPRNHTFEGFGCLDKKRAIFNAFELDSSRVLITGNWYHDDAIELFNGKDSFTFVKNVSQQRANPYIFRTAPDDVLIFSRKDTKGQDHDSILIDRLKGEPFTDPLFREWKPLHVHVPFRTEDCFIGHADQGTNAYLFPVEDNNQHVAIARVEGPHFSLLPLASAVPTRFHGQPIKYYTSILVDRKAQRAYMLASNDKSNEQSSRHYILCIDYGKAKTDGAATLTLYYTDPMPDMAATMPVLTDEGNLLLVGGKPIGNPSDNFRPSATVLLLPFGDVPAPVSAVTAGLSWWQWLCIALIILTAIATLAYLIILYKKPHTEQAATDEQPAQPNDNNTTLMLRISELMEKDQLYLNSELKLSDLADLLGTHRNYISDCINSQKGCSWSQFVNGYRIAFAQQLLRQHPDKKMSTICIKAGFTNEQSFYRTFKAFTGMTPKEWAAQND